MAGFMTIWVAYTTTSDHSERLPRPMSTSVAQLQPESAMMSVTSITTEGCAAAPGYGLISEAMLVPPGPYRLGWTALPPGAMETFGPRLQRRAVLWSMTPLHAAKDCVYVHGSCAPFTTESSAETRTLDQNLRPCWCLKVVQPQWRLRSEYPESNL